VLFRSEAAEILLRAKQERTGTIQSAEGQAARFVRLLETYRADPVLTGTELYWDTITKTLSTRPLIIIDPKSAGRKHLLLTDPFGMASGSGQTRQRLPVRSSKIERTATHTSPASLERAKLLKVTEQELQIPG